MIVAGVTILSPVLTRGVYNSTLSHDQVPGPAYFSQTQPTPRPAIACACVCLSPTYSACNSNSLPGNKTGQVTGTGNLRWKGPSVVRRCF